jgi:hypothetical protein
MSCPDCDSPGRRQFLKTAALGAASAVIPPALAKKIPPQEASEALATTLYKSLSEEQKSKVCFPFDNPLRAKVDANWHIVPQKIGQFFNADQQAMIEEIFRKLHNPDFVDKVLQHIKDDGKGLANYSAALFGEPGTGEFEFVLTGRHCTARCDGDSIPGVAFGGPIFYGHQAGEKFQESADHPNNVYWYQAKRANEVFQALSGKQREEALLGDPRAEKQNDTVVLKPKGELTGLPVSSMSRDQKRLVENVLSDLLLPFRKKDVDEAMRYIKGAGGVDALHMSFYKNLDIGNDGIWDVWQLESPSMVWYFRGFPHVHTWVNIRAKS